MDNFLINVVVGNCGEWYANFTDGSIPLHANNYQDAVMEADQILAEDEMVRWDHDVDSEMHNFNF
jgi:hypothetical protein